MNLSGLTAVTTAAEMKAWLSANCLSPISPVMTGSDLGIIIQKVMDVTEAGSAGAAGNGLTLNGREVDLGGTLDRQTTIDIATNMIQFLSSGGGSYSTTYQQRLQTGDLGQGITEAAIGIGAAGPNGNSGIDMTSDFMNVGYFYQGKQNMVSFSPEGVSFSSNDQPRANIDSDGVFHIDNLNVTHDLKVGGTVSLPTTSVITQSYTPADTDYKILIRYAGTGDAHITLPDPATVPGRVYVIQNMSSVGVKFNYDIATSDGQTITASTSTLLTGDMTIELQSDGTVWTGITDLSSAQSVHGIPAGGTAGQLLSKVDGTDYNASWTNAPASTFASLGGAPGDNTALAAALSAKADLSAGLIPFSELPNNIIDILYADLVTAISGSTLRKGQYYRITDFQTTHNIPNASPVVVNTGPTEALIVLALSSNTITDTAHSEQFPQDTIIYTTSNSAIAGATKGCILFRHDRVRNVRVCNDFRNVVYKRSRFVAPPTFDSSLAYAAYAVVTGPDGAIYYCSNPSGFAAGTATTPSLTDDNWVQIFINTTQYMGRSLSATNNINFISNSHPIHTIPIVTIDTANFVYSPMFPNYGTGFTDVEIVAPPGTLINIVFFNDNQATILKSVRIGFDTTTGVNSNTTFYVTNTGTVQNLNWMAGVNAAFVTVTGNINGWTATEEIYAATINVKAVQYSAFSIYYGIVRGTVASVRGGRFEFFVSPAFMENVNFPNGLGALKFNTSAYMIGVNFLGCIGLYRWGPNALTQFSWTYASPSTEVAVSTPWRNKTFVGGVESFFLDEHHSSATLVSMVNRASYCNIIFAGEDQPTGKTIVDITNGSPTVVNWQTDSVPFPSSDNYITAGNVAAIATYFSKHGNDFQVQQKDLISGVWTPNSSPAYTIDSLDGSGNITQVTFHPNTASGVTESRFIIV